MGTRREELVFTLLDGSECAISKYDMSLLFDPHSSSLIPIAGGDGTGVRIERAGSVIPRSRAGLLAGVGGSFRKGERRSLPSVMEVSEEVSDAVGREVNEPGVDNTSELADASRW